MTSISNNINDSFLLKYSSSCPFILPALLNKEVTIIEYDNNIFNVYEIFRIAIETSNNLISIKNNANSLKCFVIKIQGSGCIAKTWQEVEWIHYILKHVFSYDQLLFGKFSSFNMSNHDNNDGVILVIRKFERKRDKKFVAARTRSQSLKTPLLHEFHSIRKILGFSLCEIISDPDVTRKVYNNLRSELSLTIAST